MKDLSTEINILTEKTALLVERYKALKQNNESLEHENAALKEKIEEQSSLIASLETETKELKISKKMLSGEGVENKEELKKMLDTYIRDIDKCIAALDE